jgi:DNA-binding transcriptional MerR regulator
LTKGPNAFRTISEASEEVGVPQHVLRFWEQRFAFIKPMKRAGGRRFYRAADIDTLKAVRRLLQDEGLTIKGLQRLYREHGAAALSGNLATMLAASNETGLPSDAPAATSAPSDTPASRTAFHIAPRMAELRAALAEIETARARLDRVLTS